MRRVPQYHEWVAQEWERRSARNHLGREEYFEGARAYAIQQASIRRKMKEFCRHVWRYVGVWVTLGESAGSSLQEDELAPEPDPDVPDLDALTLDDIEREGASVLSGNSDVLPELATLTSDSSSIADAVSVVSRTSDVIPGLVNVTPTSVASVCSRSSESLPPLV